MSGYLVAQSRAQSFFPTFTRRAEDPEHTHYCPGCGHGIVHKLIARTIDELKIQDRTILVSPVGCAVFAYWYFDVGNVQAAHGRAAAVATAIKRARPQSIVLSYQGDGDLAAIGLAEILHAANRGEPFTVFFINNAIYAMTGGQMAPTTPLGAPTTTTPAGRDAQTTGFPLRMCELLSTLEAPVLIERVALGDNKQVAAAWRAVRRAIQAQVQGLGFSFVEILSPCPTVWGLTPIEAQRRVRDELTKTFPLGVFRDRTRQAAPRTPLEKPPTSEQLPTLLGLDSAAVSKRASFNLPVDLRVRIAGFGGQGVLFAGEVLAEAGMRAGLAVSWLPSYGPEMRSGTSNCHVRLSDGAVDSPVVSRPNVLIAMNEPSLRKFLPMVEPGGDVFYDGPQLPAESASEHVRPFAFPFSALAAELGWARSANMLMLGALSEAMRLPPPEAIQDALRSRIPPGPLLDQNLAALARGRALWQERRKSS